LSLVVRCCYRRRVLRYVVLGLLCDGQPRHGYAVAKEYSRRSGLGMNTGSFYRELQRLAAEELVRAVSNPPEADGRRAPYAITPAGKAEFESWLSNARDAWSPGYEDALSSRALFLGAAQPEVIRHVLDRWGEALWSLFRSLECEVSHQASDSHRFAGTVAPLTRSLLQARRLRHLAVELQFLEEFQTAHARAHSGTSPATGALAGARAPADDSRSPVRGRRRGVETAEAIGPLPPDRIGDATRAVARTPR
jgi:DNA-binding PadR family transcriptional regulator